MSTQCTDSGISGGILNRVQVPNVTVSPGYHQQLGRNCKNSEKELLN